jgi:ketosteroid isomerase-like protein
MSSMQPRKEREKESEKAFAEQSSGALAAFKLYTQAFGALDAQAVARHFHEPALLITPKEVIALPTATTVEETYAGIMGELPRDYVRTEFRGLSERVVGDDLAVVTGSGSWKNAANDDIMPFGMTYTLKRTAGAWRIVVAAIHAPDR